MQVNHVFREAADELIRGLFQLLLDVVLQEDLHVVGPVVRVGPLPALGRYNLPIVVNFFNLVHNLLSFIFVA